APADAGPSAAPPTGRRRIARRTSPEAFHPDDVADPHFLGLELHQLAYEQIRDSVDSLVWVLQAVAGAPSAAERLPSDG
ncbi:MAG: hypothetical protein WCF12_01410, partial [Propionicimonas sp.]